MKKLLIASTVAVTTASALTFAAVRPTTADDPAPIVAQVEDHEGRITTLEGQQEATESQVEQNTADIKDVQRRTQSAPGSSDAAPAASDAPSGQSAVTTPQDASQTPVADPDPRTVVAVEQSVNGSLRSCTYTLYSARETAFLGAIVQPIERPCVAVGEVLPRG